VGIAALVAVEENLSYNSRKENEDLIFSFFCIKAKGQKNVVVNKWTNRI